MRWQPLRYNSTMSKRRTWAATLLAAGIAGGCVALPPPADYDALVERAAAGGPVPPLELKRAFLHTADVDRRLHRLAILERQVLAAMQDNPLRLGPIGSAALDQYYASLPAHQALARFYRHVDADEQAALHESWATAIRRAIESTNDEGDSSGPYRVLSIAEAKAFLVAAGLRPVGAIYDGADSRLKLWLSGRPEQGPLRNVAFDLDELHTTITQAVARDPATLLPIVREETCKSLRVCENFNIWALIHALALTDDDAAQTYLGLEMRRSRRSAAAEGWLRQASRSNNALASLTLADIYLGKAQRAGQKGRQPWLERAERQYRLAIAAGYDSAMLNLGLLYMQGVYGTEKADAGKELITRAADLDNVEALLRLATLAYAEDPDAAVPFFRRAAAKNQRAKVEYARFLALPELAERFNGQAWRWLREVAKERDPEAMLLVGDLYAKGVHVRASMRRARSWFRKVVKAAPDNAYFVNEVAWRLAVSTLPKLRDERYALKIMERVMADESNAARSNPAYLDTWAAAYAANGDFDRAVALQEEAIEQAIANDDPNGELNILREHLATFRAGESIRETVP